MAPSHHTNKILYNKDDHQVSGARCSRGQSLIEVLVALGVFVVGIATIGFLVLDANISSRQGVERTQAILLAKEGLEAARSIRDADFDNLTAGTHGIALLSNQWIFSGISDVQDQFTRTITVTDLDIDTKKVVSSVTWQFREARPGLVSFTYYLTDWNQTQGDAGELSVDISGSVLSGGDTQLQGITLENVGFGDIRVDKMTAWWNNINLLTQIRIDSADVYGPASGVPSGTEIDITDVVLPQAVAMDINFLQFDDVMAGTDFIIKFIMDDLSTKYVLTEPGVPSAPQADSLLVDTSAVSVDPADNTKVIGITIENSGTLDITINMMNISWTGAPGGTKAKEIVINGGSVWAGNKDSGNELDITDFTLVSGSGSYPIDFLDFSKSMTGTTISITFTMGDGSTKTVSSIQP